MLYCQKCGAGNVDDARFCNMCGEKIASEGEPGGPIEGAEGGDRTMPGHSEPRSSAPPPAAGEPRTAPREPEEAPPPFSSERVNVWEETEGGRGSSAGRPEGLDVSTMSLSAMGVRSPAKAWGTLIGVALVLVGLGALGAWVVMRPDESSAPVAEADDADPDAPDAVEGGGTNEIVVGDPLPDGMEAPDVIGAPEVARGRSGGRRGSAGRSGSGSSGGGSGSSGAGTGAGAGSSGAGSGAGGGTGTGTGGSGSGSSGGSGSGSSGGSGSGSSGGSDTGSGGGSGSAGGSGAAGGSSDRNWDDMEVPEERDLEMDLYAGRVRSVIRSYYMQRAASCFEHASRNQEVRGTVLVGFDIQADGNVQNSTVDRNTTGVDSLGACLARQVGSWRLPPPPEGRAPLPMQMPFSR